MRWGVVEAVLDDGAELIAARSVADADHANDAGYRLVADRMSALLQESLRG